MMSDLRRTRRHDQVEQDDRVTVGPQEPELAAGFLEVQGLEGLDEPGEVCHRAG
jgi:hypothetical protein